MQACFSQHREQCDGMRSLQEILALEVIPHAKQKEIVDGFPETQPASSANPASLTTKLSSTTMERKLLVTLLYVCNVSQDMLALLFGVSNTSIHRYISDVCGEELPWHILGQIVQYATELLL